MFEKQMFESSPKFPIFSDEMNGRGRKPTAKTDRVGGANRVQLLALDLDGTVLSPNGHVTPRTRDAIRAVIESGITVCIATGRSWWESRSVIAEARLEGPGVFAGGAIVNDMPSGKSLAHTKMRPIDARHVCHIMDESGLAAMVMQDAFHAESVTGEPTPEWLISAELEMPPTVPEWLAHHSSSYRRVQGLRSAAHDWTIRVSTVANYDASELLFNRLGREMGDRIYLHQITIPTTGTRVLEVFDRSVNKWTGVRQIAGMIDVPDENIIAVGDDMNDLHMLEHAGLGVAMGNANEHVKRIADGEIDSHAEDGLAVFLEKLLAGDALMTSARRAVREA